MNSPHFFEIQADDVSRAKSFYGDIFGWKFTKQEGLPIEYYAIETEGIRGGLLGRPVPAPHGPAGTNAAVISMEVKDFDHIAELILGQGGVMAMPKFAVPGKCWQGYFLDPEGNTFGMFEVDEKAA